MTPHAVVSLTVGGAEVKGGVKFYRGSPGAARSYVEADRSRADDYYLAEGTGLADRLIGTAAAEPGGSVQVTPGGTLDGDDYERWVAGHDTHGAPKGRLRTDDQALRFVEVVVNGPKTWSLAAAVHPEISAAYDAAQDRAAEQIVAWLIEHATTRVGPRGRQVQVPVDQIEAAVVRHHTSRAGDPHRHLHLQINARVQVAGRWRGLHTVGVVNSIEAINGIGHAAIATDHAFRRALADHGYTLDPATAEIAQLQPYAAGFSARASQISRHVDRFEADWRTEHPGTEPGPALRRAWNRRAWATARPDKVVPTDGTDLTRRWLTDLTDAGFTPPTPPPRPAPGVKVPTAPAHSTRPGPALEPAAVADLALIRLGGRRSAWNIADVRGEVEKILTTHSITTGRAIAAPARRALAEDLTCHTIGRCIPLLRRSDVSEHIRHLTSTRVLAVEADIVDRLTTRGAHRGLSVPPSPPASTLTTDHDVLADGNPDGNQSGNTRSDADKPRVRVLDQQQRDVAHALAGTHPILLVEGAAGAGKTTTLAAARDLIEADWRRLVVVTPTRKAAQVATRELGTPAFTAAQLAHQHGYRFDDDDHWTRDLTAVPDHEARLEPGDVLLVDEAGMLTQDTARALLTIADESHAQIALVGDRYQLPAVGRGGVLDLAHRWTPAHAHLELDTIHRFTDPAYADLTLAMRTGTDPGGVFDALFARGRVVLHPSEVQRTATLAAPPEHSGHAGRTGATLLLADTREQAKTLSAACRDQRSPHDLAPSNPTVTTNSGELIGVGDLVATRRNDRHLGVANRDRWTVTAIDHDGHQAQLRLRGRSGSTTVPATYARDHVELAYASTVHGAQGETVDHAHFLLGDHTGAASAYVAMTRGRHTNTAHLVADTTADARAQWIAVFDRNRADLGPQHATTRAWEDLQAHGPLARPRISPWPNSPSNFVSREARSTPAVGR